jgi:hypothetical protein
MPPASPFLEEIPDPIACQPRDNVGDRSALRPDRPWYATGVPLDADDFEAEQLYHRARLAEALSAVAGCGTLAGLEVTIQPAKPATGGTPAQEEEIQVQPGQALDRFGRLIEVPRSACLRSGRWLAGLTPNEHLRSVSLDGKTIEVVVADVFIRFLALPRGYTPALAAGPFDATDAVQPSRIRDSYKLELVARAASLDLAHCLPADPWTSLRDESDPNQRWKTLRKLLLAGQQSTSRQWENGSLKPRPEHKEGVDPTSLFLARLQVPALQTSANTLARAEGAVQVDNNLREFVISNAALSAWAGLPVRSTP